MVNSDCAYEKKRKEGNVENAWNPEELSDRSSTGWYASLWAPFVDDNYRTTVNRSAPRETPLFDGAHTARGSGADWTGPGGRCDALYTNRLAVR